MLAAILDGFGRPDVDLDIVKPVGATLNQIVARYRRPWMTLRPAFFGRGPAP
jgi:hypothetical protein